MPLPACASRPSLGLLLTALLAACGGDSTSAPNIASLEVSPSSASLVSGATQTLTATARDSKGSAIAGASIAWTSSSDAVVTVSASGLVTAVAPGTATISASSGGRSATATLTVKAGGVVSASGGVVSAEGGAVKLDFPAGAVPAATSITIAPRADSTGNEHALAGTAYEFGPDGIQFPQPVKLELKFDAKSLPASTPASALRIAKLVGGKWQILSEGVAVDSASGTVRASIRSFSSYGVVRDPCVIGTLPMGAISGQISPNDCLYTVAGRRSDYYAFQVPSGQLVSITTGGPLKGLMGIKEATADPAAGIVWNSVSIGAPMRLISNGSPLQLFVSGQDSTHYGGYSVTRATAPIEHSCETATAIMPGVSFGAMLNQQNSCVVTIKFSATPQANGRPLWAHYYYAKLEAGKTYTIHLGGVSSSFNAGLTVFSGGQPVAQSVPTGQAVSSRSVTVTPGATGYHTIEIGSGIFTDDALTRWVNQSGAYTLALSEAAGGCTVAPYTLGSAVSGSWDAGDCKSTGRRDSQDPSGAAYDQYEMTLATPQAFRVELAGANGRTVRIRRKGGEYVALSPHPNFAPPASNPLAIKYVLEPGTYVIEAQAPAAGVVGSYTLSTALEEGITCRPIVFGTPGITLTGSIDPATDCRTPISVEWYEDWLVMLLKTGEKLRFTMTTTEMAPLLVWRDDRLGPDSPTLKTVSSDKPGTITLEWTATFDGWHEMVISRANGTTPYGRYTLKVERIP